MISANTHTNNEIDRDTHFMRNYKWMIYDELTLALLQCAMAIIIIIMTV